MLFGHFNQPLGIGEVDDLFEVSYSLDVPPQFFVDSAPVVVSLSKVGIQFDSLIVIGDSMLVIILAIMNKPAVVVGLSEVGVKIDSFIAVGDGPLEIILVIVGKPAVAVGLGILGV